MVSMAQLPAHGAEGHTVAASTYDLTESVRCWPPDWGMTRPFRKAPNVFHEHCSQERLFICRKLRPCLFSVKLQNCVSYGAARLPCIKLNTGHVLWTFEHTFPISRLDATPKLELPSPARSAASCSIRDLALSLNAQLWDRTHMKPGQRYLRSVRSGG